MQQSSNHPREGVGLQSALRVFCAAVGELGLVGLREGDRETEGSEVSWGSGVEKPTCILITCLI